MTKTCFKAAGAILAAGCLLLAGCAGSDRPSPADSFDQAADLAAQNQSLILVEFYADW